MLTRTFNRTKRHRITTAFASMGSSMACCLLLAALIPVPAIAANPTADGSASGSLAALYEMPRTPIQTRWYTFENTQGTQGTGGKKRFGRKGAPCTGLGPGKQLVLADIEGSGTIRRIWMTLWKRDATTLRGIKIEMYWDGATTPAVQAPLGDFFCHSLGHFVRFENACFSSPEGRSLNCNIPMPFRKHAKIVLTNESDVGNGVYYDVAATVGDPHGEDTLYFHSFWRRENYTKLRRDMAILPQVEGRGRFLGCHLGDRLHPEMTHFWWGEGEVKVYLDGDTEYPTLCGTGTEDYVGSAYGQGLFNNRYQGNHFVAEGNKAYGFYRFHIPDPIYFYEAIRVTIQVMGGPRYSDLLEALDKNPSLKFMKAGDGTQYYTREELEAHPKRAEVMERIDDYCATAYWYMDKPENGLGPIADVAERLKDLP